MDRKKILAYAYGTHLKPLHMWQLWRNCGTTGDPPVLLWSVADHRSGQARSRRGMHGGQKASCRAAGGSYRQHNTVAAACLSCLSLLCLDLDTRNVRPRRQSRQHAWRFAPLLALKKLPRRFFNRKYGPRYLFRRWTWHVFLFFINNNLRSFELLLRQGSNVTWYSRKKKGSNVTWYSRKKKGSNVVRTATG
jgi:hypothetical protein